MAALHQLETLTPQEWAIYNGIRARPDYWTTGDKTLLKKLINVRCPRCKADNCKPYGSTRSGQDRFLCRSCRRSFVKNDRPYSLY